MYLAEFTNGKPDSVVGDFFGSLDSFLRTSRNTSCGCGFALDLIETPESYTIRVDLPGVAKENVEAILDGTVLTITVKEAKAEAPGKEVRMLHRERQGYSGTRQVELPLAVSQTVNASLKEGVLTIEVKKDEEKRARRIAIE